MSQPTYLPTPAEIAKMCEELRANRQRPDAPDVAFSLYLELGPRDRPQGKPVSRGYYRRRLKIESERAHLGL